MVLHFVFFFQMTLYILFTNSCTDRPTRKFETKKIIYSRQAITKVALKKSSYSVNNPGND